MAKDIKEHGVDFFKLLGAMGVITAMSLGAMKTCGGPWGPPIAEAKRELRADTERKIDKAKTESTKDHDEMKKASEKAHERLEGTVKEYRGEVKDQMRNLGRKIDRHYSDGGGRSR